jgi:muconolactone delta-isomerase
MEFLVIMTTEVPGGTTPAEVADMRAREAAHTRELAGQGRVLRLWRPQSGPHEWRTIGLFAAGSPGELESTLASMPLHVWRTDEVVALGLHSNDPGRGEVRLMAGSEEFLVTFILRVPDGESPETIDEMSAGEAARVRKLAAEGWLLRLWTLPGHGRSLGHWQAAGVGPMRDILRSLPLASWLTTETARQAHAAGAKLVLTGRDQGRLDAARDELGASAAVVDLGDPTGLHRFFTELRRRSITCWSPAAARSTHRSSRWTSTGAKCARRASAGIAARRAGMRHPGAEPTRGGKQNANPGPSRRIADVPHRHPRPPPRRGTDPRRHRGPPDSEHRRRRADA